MCCYAEGERRAKEKREGKEKVREKAKEAIKRESTQDKGQRMETKAAERAKKAEELAKKLEGNEIKEEGVYISYRTQEEDKNTHPDQPSTSRASTSSGARASEEIDTNECCVCFRTFAEDTLEVTGLE